MKTKEELIEESIISFLDGELTTQEAEQLMDEISQNESYQSLLSAYEKAYLQPESEIVFADKPILLKPEKTFILPLKSIVGIAASLVLLMGLILTWQQLKKDTAMDTTVEQKLVQTQSPKTDIEIEKEKEEEKTLPPAPTPTVNKGNTNPAIPKNIVVQKKEAKKEIEIVNIKEILATTKVNPYQNIDKINNTPPSPRLQQKQEIEMAYLDFQSPIQNKTDNYSSEVEVKIAGVDVSEKMNEVQFIRARLNEIKDKATEGLSLLQDASKPKFLNTKNTKY